jgi:hypothetical protein
MPKLPPQVIDSVFYLYRTPEDAAAGKNAGGTGFFVAMPSRHPNQVFLYAVSNWHVVRHRTGASVIRVNKNSGGTDSIALDPSEWHCRPQHHDLAVALVSLSLKVHKVKPLHQNMLVTKKMLKDLHIGPGEDTFMVGHFADHPGVVENVPAIRFGHISTMPQPIPQETGAKDLSSFIIDTHSRTGYSGSPVFVYRTIGSDLTPREAALNLGPDSTFLALLGIHWGQFPEMWEIKSGTAPVPQGIEVERDSQWVRGMSGMTMVIPAWDILELLESEVLRAQRKASDDFVEQQNRPDTSADS